VPYRRTKLTFAISSPDEFLSVFVLKWSVFDCCYAGLQGDGLFHIQCGPY